MTTASPPSTAVIRVSTGNFDPARFEEVEQMTRATGSYLIPAIGRLDGLIAYYAGASVEGSIGPRQPVADQRSCSSKWAS